MNEKFNLDQIREYWMHQAQRVGESPAVSWSDKMVIEMEIREILKYLVDGDRVLDVGCANGYSTVQFAYQKNVTILGVDYIPEMIEQARRRLSVLESRLLGKVEFKTGDVTSLQVPTGVYDTVISIRVIINLAEWDLQVKGLRECARVLKPGGKLLLSEATLQGWHHLNKFRREWGLTDIPMPAFNHYLDQDQVIEALAPEMELIDLSNFASTYYVGTRLLKPLLIKALGIPIDVADPNMEWNRWFAQLPAWGDYGTQKMFIFRKQ